MEKSKTDAAFSQTLVDLEESFLNTEYKKIFCGAPAGCYRDCTAEDRKHDNKKYFQFSQEYADFVRTTHKGVLEAYPLLADFFTKVEAVDAGAKRLFKELLTPLQTTHPDLVQAMYKGRGEQLTVITKVLSYDPSTEELGTSPHYDKSGVTIILDNDDQVNDRLVVGPHHQPFDFSKLKAPQRQFDGNGTYSSALFIAGSLLRHQGIAIDPTPHAVLPVKSQHNRHSLIAFALLPYIDMNGPPTTITDKTELMKETAGISYLAAKVLLQHPYEASFLLANRQIGDTFGFEVPGGRVNIDFKNKKTETLEECALREGEEELGLKLRLQDYLGSYPFFWESQANTCTHCVVYLAGLDPSCDLTQMQPIGDTDGNPIRPEWVPMSKILSREITIRDNHQGLWPILEKAVSWVQKKS
ncbi:MAG: NUDIX hydrolase [Holosporales bacterium]|nr:NUDIX hydrolase [Holosporales bacterium]